MPSACGRCLAAIRFGHATETFGHDAIVTLADPPFALRTWWYLEWNAHQGLALKVGVEPSVLDVVRTSGALTSLSDKDAAVVRFGRQMFRDKKMEPATFAKVVEYFGRTGAMDMVAVMNTYAVSGFYAIAVDERAPEGRLDLLSSPVR